MSKEPEQVHCSECERGGNGDRSCAAGWTVMDRRGANRYMMCFAGKKINGGSNDKNGKVSP